ncbi:MAG: cytochrome-c peroxidase, partial [Chloroflexi bacterium]|nr:cytochrome-c peroxidase [Chloroflexota bacterium]
MGCVFTPPTDTGTPLGSLLTVTKPEDPQLAPGGPFIRDQAALVQLGKAFFWDQQAGSDGEACASCHFSAGADPRTKNQISPGLNRTTADGLNPTGTSLVFDIGGGPNHTLTQHDFPFHQFIGRTNAESKVLRDSDNVVSSEGVFSRTYVNTPRLPFFGGLGRPYAAADTCVSVPDDDNFQVGGVNVRRVEPRNAPTVINALFFDRLFWDGRAQDVFNGV